MQTLRNVRFGCLVLWCLAIMSPFSVQAASLNINAGWSLLSSRTDIDAKQLFAGQEDLLSIWAWQNQNWSVLLPNGNSTAYAQAKGFQALSTIPAGEGFWVNAKNGTQLSFNGTQETQNSLDLLAGWNLKGLLSDQALDVGTVFSDQDQITSLWAWKGSTWAVSLPGQNATSYAASKGFQVLTSLKPGQGFWVNAGNDTTVSWQGVATPPLLGKVSEVSGKNDKNAYIPVSGAKVWVDGISQGTTDSKGVFSCANCTGSAVTVALQKKGFVPFQETLTVPESKQIYCFIQKEDPNKEILNATQTNTGLSKVVLKPTPKVIASYDKKTILAISNMQLEKDVTCSVTPYKSLNTVPEVESIQGEEGQDLEILAGGHIQLLDSKGAPISSAAAGFSAMVKPASAAILGKWTMSKVQSLLASNATQLSLYTKQDSGWKQVGSAQMKTSSTGSQFFLRAGPGIFLKHLKPFLFVAATPKTGTEPLQTISGTITDATSQKGIPGVFVGLDGLFNETVTDAAGAFSLAVRPDLAETLDLKMLFLYAWKDGYEGGFKEIPLNSNTTSTDLNLALQPFTGGITLSGKVLDNGTQAIPDAMVTLKTPSVLDKVEFEPNQVHVGVSDQAVYSWEIHAENATQQEPALLKTITGQGKRTLSLKDLESLIQAGQEHIFLIRLSVVHPSGTDSGDEPFEEQAVGMVYVYPENGETRADFDLMPDMDSPPLLEAWTGPQGGYEFYDLDPGFIPFLKVQAEAEGYAASPFVSLPEPQDMAVSKDIALKPKIPVDPILEDFETAGTGWSASLLHNGTTLTSHTKWQLLDHPEQVVLPDSVLEKVVFADMGWVDVPGTITTITLNTAQSSPEFKIANATVAFQENGENATLRVLLFDDLPEGSPDGYYDYMELSPTHNQGEYDVWYDFGEDPDQTMSMNLTQGSQVMVSYPGTTEQETLSLLPAWSGSQNYWMGNLQDADYKGTYYDPSLTQKGLLEALLTSPLIDLTQFDTVTLRLKTWFEVAAQTRNSLTLEVALMDPGLDANQTVFIESEFGGLDMQKGAFYPLDQLNPVLLMQEETPAPSDEGALYKQTAHKGLWKEASLDLDGDGMDDDWESLWPCAPDGDLDPNADPGQDGYTSFEEWEMDTDPCYAGDPAVGSQDEDQDGMDDQWESFWSCAQAGNLEPEADPDADGMTNIEEYWNGTNPCEADTASPGSDNATAEPAVPVTMDGEFAPLHWQELEYNLSPLAGHTIQFRFAVRFENAAGNIFRGAALDDVEFVDEKTWLPFELMTPEFGYFGEYSFEPVPQGETWAGTYTLQLNNVLAYDLQDPQSEPQAYSQDSQTVTLTQDENYASFPLVLGEYNCTLEGTFQDESYTSLDYFLYDSASQGMELWGWGQLIDDPESDLRGGSITVETSDGMRYEGNLDLLPE